MPHVLYVDDDHASRDILVRLLTYQKVTVDTVETANDVLTRVKEQNYDLIVIDLALPDLDGWELLKALQQNTTSTVKAVALTAYYDASVAKQAKQSGFVACLPKPATLETAKTVQSLLAG